MKDEGGRRKTANCFSLHPSAFMLLLLLTASASVPATPVATPTPITPTPIPSALFVDAARSIGPISPYVFGTNYGPWIFLMPAVKPKAVEAGIKYLRYPGGEYGDSVDLMEYQIADVLRAT